MCLLNTFLKGMCIIAIVIPSLSLNISAEFFLLLLFFCNNIVIVPYLYRSDPPLRFSSSKSFFMNSPCMYSHTLVFLPSATPSGCAACIVIRLVLPLGNTSGLLLLDESLSVKTSNKIKQTTNETTHNVRVRFVFAIIALVVCWREGFQNVLRHTTCVARTAILKAREDQNTTTTTTTKHGHFPFRTSVWHLCNIQKKQHWLNVKVTLGKHEQT